MKRTIGLALLLLLFALVFYVFVWGQSGDWIRGKAEVFNGPAVLCTGPHVTNDGIMTYKWLPISGTLQIEMQDGSVKEIDLNKVKMMRVQQVYQY